MTLIGGIYSVHGLSALDANSQDDEHWPHRLHVLTLSGPFHHIQQDPQIKTLGEYTLRNFQVSPYY